MKHTLLLGAISLAIVGCASGFNQKEYNDLATQAENEIKLAGKSGFLWANTEKFLKESKEAMATATKAGDRATRRKEFDKAMKLAKQALQEAKLSQQQAKDNASPNTKIP
jgi:outer membrane murein-binding lipoprotein Lpp